MSAIVEHDHTAASQRTNYPAWRQVENRDDTVRVRRLRPQERQYLAFIRATFGEFCGDVTSSA
jgi:hypothetical protein